MWVLVAAVVAVGLFLMFVVWDQLRGGYRDPVTGSRVPPAGRPPRPPERL